MGRYPIFSYECGRCGRAFEAPEVLGDYGNLGARSLGAGTLIHVRALEDPVFDEVGKIVEDVLEAGHAEVTERRKGQIVQAAYSVACDPDRDGSPFVIGRKPRCPSCGSPSMASWSQTGDEAGIDLPPPTHEVWASMPESDRRTAVAAVVSDELSM